MYRKRPTLEQKADRCLVVEISPTQYEVTGPYGDIYDVRLFPKGWSCTCTYWTMRAGKCSHIIAAQRYRGD
jgi:hypothetical protein